MRNENTTCSGFTLVELLLVLVLIAISVAAITPQLGGSISGWQLTEGSKSMLAAIKLAQHLALTRQEIMVFALDTNNASFTVRSIGNFANSHSIGKNSLVPRQFLGKDVKIVQLEGFRQIDSEQGLVFWPDGRTKAAHVTLAGNQHGETSEWHILIKNDGSAVLEEVFEK